MGIISGFALIFIVYEISKIVYASKFLALLEKSRENKIDGQIMILSLVEVIYFLYVFVLPFTAYWYVGFFLLLFSILFYKSIKIKELIIFDSILSISFLSLILIL